MPDWTTHIKWAAKLGIERQIADHVNKVIDIPDEVLKNDPTELGELYRQDPESVKKTLVGHDWGRKSKARLKILKAYCKTRFGKKGIMAAELHHILDYITYIRDPENLAKLIASSLKHHSTRGKSMEERILTIRKYFKSKEYRDHVEKLTNELIKLDYESYKELIVELLTIKIKEWMVTDEVSNFIMNNLDGILSDIDRYLRRKKRRIARGPNTLDKYFRQDK